MININNIADKFSIEYKKCIISFVSSKVNRRRSESIGSGFFVSYNGEKFLLTARHVIEEVKTALKEKRSTIIVGYENAIELHLKDVITSQEIDAAIIPIDWMIGHQNLKDIFFPNISFSEAAIDPYYGMFMGYPAAKNQNDLYGDTQKRMLFGYGGVREKEIGAVDGVYIPLGFSMNINKSIAGINRPPESTVSPRPQGISGGPVIGIHCKSDGRGGIDESSFIHEICGIAVSQIRAFDFNNRGVFVAESLFSIKNTLDDICMRMKRGSSYS